MRDYGKVFSRIWESTDFRSLSEDGRTLALYLLTCQHGTIAGVFRVPDGYACEDLQWDAERVSKGFANLQEKGFATRCEATKWVWLHKFLEHNPPENPNQRKAAAKMAMSVPDQCVWKLDFIRFSGESLGLDMPKVSKPSGTVSEPLLNQYQEQKQEQYQEQKEEKTPRKRSAAPEVVCPDDVDKQTWTDWLTLRRKKSAPVTATVVNGARLEAERAGMSLDAFLQVWCLRGSQGLQADWLKPHERQTQSRVSFADHDEQARRRRWEEMTGRKWPEAGDVIDVTPTTQRIEA